jgi:hypothetical protein
MGAEIIMLNLWLPPMTEKEVSDCHLNCAQSMETQ